MALTHLDSTSAACSPASRPRLTGGPSSSASSTAGPRPKAAAPAAARCDRRPPRPTSPDRRSVPFLGSARDVRRAERSRPEIPIVIGHPRRYHVASSALQFLECTYRGFGRRPAEVGTTIGATKTPRNAKSSVAVRRVGTSRANWGNRGDRIGGFPPEPKVPPTSASPRFRRHADCRRRATARSWYAACDLCPAVNESVRCCPFHRFPGGGPCGRCFLSWAS
jgi:hypothetical protein